MHILIADDHVLVREGLAHVLRSAFEGVSIHEAADFGEVHATLAEVGDIDLVLLDLCMPGGQGMDVLENICDQYPDVPLIVLSASEDPAEIRTSIDRGASGFIPKSSARELAISAIRLVMSGGVYLPPQLVHAETQPRVPHPAPPSRGVDAGLEALTDRQHEVFQLMRRGLSNKEIARELGLSPNTVKIHVKAILRVLKASNRTQAVMFASIPD